MKEKEYKQCKYCKYCKSTSLIDYLSGLGEYYCRTTNTQISLESSICDNFEKDEYRECFIRG